MDSHFLDKITFTRVLNPKYHGNLIGGLHAHKNDYQLIYIEKGEGIVAIENEIYSVSQRDLICIRPDQLHCSYDEAPTYFELIEILWYFKDAIQPDLNLKQITRLEADSEIVHCLNCLIAEALVKRTRYQLMMKLLLAEILLYLERMSPQSLRKEGEYFDSTQSQRVRKVLDYIHLNYKQNLSLDDMAKIAGISSHYLCRIFKQFTNYSPINYWIKIRLDIAIDLLKNSDYNISEIAEMVGFEDIYYFSRLFKKWMGQSPSHFMKS